SQGQLADIRRDYLWYLKQTRRSALYTARAQRASGGTGALRAERHPGSGVCAVWGWCGEAGGGRRPARGGGAGAY
ncbi:hypothetical protein, partial [Streptomyces sp. NPDC003032]